MQKPARSHAEENKAETRLEEPVSCAQLVRRPRFHPRRRTGVSSPQSAAALLRLLCIQVPLYNKAQGDACARGSRATDSPLPPRAQPGAQGPHH